MLIETLQTRILEGNLDEKLALLYGSDQLAKAKQRVLDLIARYLDSFGDGDVLLISAPGRTEIGGNHTDHQRGRVLAAAVHMDVLVLVGRNDRSIVDCRSEGFEISPVDIRNTEILTEESFTSEALIRGVSARFAELGFKTGGFNCVMHSTVLKGSGISSSAAFEVAIGTILNHLYNEGSVDAPTIAKVGQFAENLYFNKPCGLMDQMASSVGGFVFIDFFNQENPEVEKITFDFSKSGYTLCIVDTGGSHEDLSNEYGLFPLEMKKVAAYFGKEVLSEVDPNRFFESIFELREAVGDRAILRAMHFFQETERVVAEVEALSTGDFDSFLELVVESGRSSAMYLQNVFVASHTQSQGLSLALALSESYLKGRGAWRVHGGGLAGTIQAIVKNEDLPGYRAMIEAVFQKGSCHVMKLRDEGGFRIA